MLNGVFFIVSMASMNFDNKKNAIDGFISCLMDFVYFVCCY